MSKYNGEEVFRQMKITAGPYNLIQGSLPEIEGKPIEPWSAEAAYQRLRHVAPKVPLSISPDVVLLPSNSNDAWLIGDKVLRVCWRGDRNRFLKEVQLATSLPESIPYPKVREWGSDDSFSWILSDYVPGVTLASIWGSTPPDHLRSIVVQLSQMLRILHEWTPPPEVAHLLDMQVGEKDDAIAIVGRAVVPLPVAITSRLINFARSMPFVDSNLLDAVNKRLLKLVDSCGADTQPCVVTHGDACPVNIVVRNGKIVGLLDFEWACFGARDLEVVPLLHWGHLQDASQSARRLIEWMREGYPELFNVPDIDRRMWLYQLAYYIRGLIVWPPDGSEEDLDVNHPIRRLRILIDRPLHHIG